MRKFICSILVFGVAFFAASVTKVSAAKILTDQKGTVTVAKGEVINDDLFIGAATAEVDGTVNGDVFIGAQTVKVTGIINGNLHIGAQNIILTGANIKGTIIAGGQTINIDSTSVIGGSIMVGGETVSIDSQVKRNVFVGSGMFTLGDNARIGKDLYYAAGTNQANISTKAKITGSVYKSETKNATQSAAMQQQSARFLAGARFGTSMISYLGILIVWLILMKLFGKRLAGATDIVSRSFWKSIGIGFLAVVALVPALIILLITIIGIPLAGLILMIFALFSFLSKLVVGGALGNWMAAKFGWKMNAFWPFALGLLIIYILKLVPIVGGLAGFAVLLLGLGALILQASSMAE